MAKKNFDKGIDRVFSPTARVEEIKETEEVKESEGAGDVVSLGRRETAEPVEAVREKRAKETKKAYANYNLHYPKELQKRIKRFCIENDGVDMKDVFIEGAEMYLERCR